MSLITWQQTIIEWTSTLSFCNQEIIYETPKPKKVNESNNKEFLFNFFREPLNIDNNNVDKSFDEFLDHITWCYNLVFLNHS